MSYIKVASCIEDSQVCIKCTQMHLNLHLIQVKNQLIELTLKLFQRGAFMYSLVTNIIKVDQDFKSRIHGVHYVTFHVFLSFPYFFRSLLLVVIYYINVWEVTQFKMN